ncbi:lactonase family protein [Spirillospora sp. CA-294931]|uniref:lactonase family protein n=1 Tax=Spirillospora sp. CA-294931 TaxID=3240042 RepID=UPI003D8D457C
MGFSRPSAAVTVAIGTPTPGGSAMDDGPPHRRRFLGLAGAAAMTSAFALPGERTDLAFLGGYTSAGGRGLLVARAGPAGTLTVRESVDVPDPSFLALSPGGRRLYAVSEVDDGRVLAFALTREGSPRPLGHRSAHGAAPAHLSVHPSGRYLLSATYSGGTVAVHPIRPDGSLGPSAHVVRHDGAEPHPHQIVTAPDGRFVLAVDLGTDSVLVYRLDLATGRLDRHSRARLRPGAGPRHLAFHPGGHTAYVINELDSTVTVCAYDRGRLTPGQIVSTVPEGTTTPNYPGEILVSPDGRHVYGTNRGHDSVAVFATRGRRLRLVTTVACGGHWPRHMELARGGRLLYVANQRSGSVTAFTVSGARLEPAGTPLTTPAPACVLPRF